ncbi:MAG: alanine--tRNA ligase [Rhizobiales bacterium]|nr:alanine--tRNA ligase [Hyphomicrobiales bacterium]
MTSVNDIRKAFLSYFSNSEHKVVSSGPLVPRNDPTLMFTNAGMVQFKNYFTGLETPPYPRATTSQKCVRAGGKHNDLDNVGYTARHHTFFEMLGNFSFGDYFKEQAIEHAWTLITRDFAINKDRLLVTVYSEDDEAFGLWRKIAGLPESRIIRIPTSDNFWAMGDTGPCGPCSEIFYDHGDHIWGGPPGSQDEDGDRFIEIWNLVFMQFEQVTKDQRINLPKPSIDTGMGLERIAALLQGKHDNYDIDLFQALIAASVEATGVKAEGDQRASHRVIADHLRATSFLIADGVLPSNEGRGYVLRRIMRRAMRHAHLLGAKEPLIFRLVPTLVAEMGQAYPELLRAEAMITETLRLEEERFRRTLDRGLTILDQATKSLHDGDVLDGETAFKLYDTYGFPLDLTQDALRSRKIEVALDGFNAAMERQKAEARASWTGSGDAATETIWLSLRERLGASEFLGYEMERAEGVVTALVASAKEIPVLNAGEDGAIICNQTPFYGESGGQVGDTGEIRVGEALFRVSDTQKRAGGLFVHYGMLETGSIKVGDPVELVVDHHRRRAIRANHSATHLVHEALREVLGPHVAQKGSLVSDERLRFDFSHTKPMSEEELARVEDIANEIVLQNGEVMTRIMAVDDAIAAGAMALFGEKYGDEVRVVSMGTATVGEKSGKTYSLELCGGIHVRRVGDIGMIRLVQETASAAGVRRIEALTGNKALAEFRTQDRELRNIAGLLKTGVADVAPRVEALLKERRRLEKDLNDAKRQLALSGGGGADDKPVEINGIAFLSRILHGIAAKELKGIVDEAKQSLTSGVVALVGISEDGKAGIAVGVTADLTSRLSAVDLVRAGSVSVGGQGGGGRPDMAQAGGPDGDQAEAAIDAIKALLESA